MAESLKEDPFKGDVSKIEMSRYIDLDIYHAVEKSHPYYIEMIDEIHVSFGKMGVADGGRRLLEIGAGTGLATETFLEFPFEEVVALDLDQHCCEILRQHLGNAVTSVCGNALTYRAESPFHVAVSVFAHDHISSAKAPEFLASIRANLVPGGHYIVGAEFLPYYETPEEWREALYTYHGFIVDKALREENFELAQIEISALKSGLYHLGDYKRHEQMFEAEMDAAGFTLVDKVKAGPTDLDNVGGIFVYTYQTPE